MIVIVIVIVIMQCTMCIHSVIVQKNSSLYFIQVDIHGVIVIVIVIVIVHTRCHSAEKTPLYTSRLIKWCHFAMHTRDNERLYEMFKKVFYKI